MDYNDGFGKLEAEFISVCEEYPINFGVLEEMIKQGVNLNAVHTEYNDNILATVIENAMHYHHPSDETDDEYNSRREDFLKLVQFFLDNGFDLNTKNGEFGSQCLRALLYGNEIYKLSVAKILIQHGAKLIDFVENPDDEYDKYETINAAYFNASYESDFNKRPAYGCLQYAYYVLLSNAFLFNTPYSGIEYMTAAQGRKIKRVFAIAPDSCKVFFSDNGRDNCFNTDLCFELEGIWLYISDFLEIHADTESPVDKLVDVSADFEDIIGKTIGEIYFEAGKYSKNMYFDFNEDVQLVYPYPAETIHVRFQEEGDRIITITNNSWELKMSETKDENDIDERDCSKYYAYIIRER